MLILTVIALVAQLDRREYHLYIYSAAKDGWLVFSEKSAAGVT
jgi:hypothetical protein